MSTKSETLRNMQAAFGSFLEENEDAIQRYHTEIANGNQKLDLSDVNLRNVEWAGESLVVSLTDYDGDDVSYSIPFTFFDDPDKFIEEDKRQKAEKAAKVERLRAISRVKTLRDQAAQAAKLLADAEAALSPEDLKKAGPRR